MLNFIILYIQWNIFSIPLISTLSFIALVPFLTLSISFSISPLQNFLFSLLNPSSTFLSNCTFNKNQSRGFYYVQNHWWLFIIWWIFLVWCQDLNYVPPNTPSISFAFCRYLTLEITSYLPYFMSPCFYRPRNPFLPV